MKIICILLLIGCILGCNLKPKSRSQQAIPVANAQWDEKTDSVVSSLVESLPEYKNLGTRFRKNLDGSHHLSLFIAQRPDSSFKFYWVQAGDDNPDRFETLYNFYVNLKDSSVYFYDTVSDSVLTIQKWRKSGQDDLLH